MTPYSDYPADYRAAQVAAIVRAVQAGESVSVVGLSGAGKSNLLGYLAARQPWQTGRMALVDCNRLPDRSLPALFRLIIRALGDEAAGGDLEAVDRAIERRLDAPLCLLFDRFDALNGDDSLAQIAAANLRALRDAHKYSLTYVTATRRPLPAQTEFAELFHANTLWLGPLSESDTAWNVARYARRRGVDWEAESAAMLARLSGGYPSLLRAVCEAHAAGAAEAEIAGHSAVQARLAEFWADEPSEEELTLSGLAGIQLLAGGRAPSFDTTQLTAKENLLLQYFQSRPGEVCEKDDLIRAVWPEDRVYEKGVRDDSLAQLVRRLREKIEPEPSAPKHIHTVPGRGYRFTAS